MRFGHGCGTFLPQTDFILGALEGINRLLDHHVEFIRGCFPGRAERRENLYLFHAIFLNLLTVQPADFFRRIGLISSSKELEIIPEGQPCFALVD